MASVANAATVGLYSRFLNENIGMTCRPRLPLRCSILLIEAIDGALRESREMREDPIAACWAAPITEMSDAPKTRAEVGATTGATSCAVDMILDKQPKAVL